MPVVDPHHDPSSRCVDQPHPQLGDTVTVSVEMGTEPVSEAWLRTVHDGEQEWSPGVIDGPWIRFELPCRHDVVNYRFHLELPAGSRWLTGLGVIDYDPGDVHDFKLVTSGRPPAWINDPVWYQIFPDRFATTGRHRRDLTWAQWAEWGDPVATGPAAATQLYGGDLDGVATRLDHLSSLGIGGIYLNPVFPARSSHRYDASTFDHVDPLLGGDRALVGLTRAAHERGIRIITDLTLNHTGRDHDWFRRARDSADSTEAGFYHFTDHPDRYESWLGISSLPKLDHRSDELRRRFYQGADSVLAKYLLAPFHLDGWRIDVANMTGRLGRIDVNAEVARIARSTSDAVDPDRWLVAEHFFDAGLDAPGDGWHGVMNYAGVARPIASWLGRFESLSAFTAGPGQAERNGVQMARTMDQVRAAMPWAVTMGSMSLLASHDTARWRTMASSDEAALIGFGLLLALPGSPTLLYGDEVGLGGATSEAARTPMPWDDRAWDRRFLAWYRELIAVRNRERALQVGGFRWVNVDADEVVFLRETAEDRLLIRAARAPTPDVPVAVIGGSILHGVFNADRIAPTARGPATTFTLPGDGPGFSIWRIG